MGILPAAELPELGSSGLGHGGPCPRLASLSLTLYSLSPHLSQLIREFWRVELDLHSGLPFGFPLHLLC